MGAACAIHPELQAVAACSRCGTFSCGGCLSQTPAGSPPLCAACVARTSVSQLPWDYRDDLGWLKAWFKSLGAQGSEQFRVSQGLAFGVGKR